ncbi:mannose-1-phosphate guanylyltransferase/mannose-6-phosphate isomerase [Granulosicoccus sp. 3-233]|uniref:mannose-1-phosphate guanylyltransferase/mannose-6-phosphate isomerase n=1 Tax=Granulosicoccus sp. 3-233 TaxID=3417969 RepID=UPI003D34828D
MSSNLISTAPITPVILAGGSGTRLWPLSRTAYPKQFLSVGGDQSYLQQTALRCLGTCEHAPVVICNEEHRFLVAEQMKSVEVHTDAILLEPVARNTAPAIAVAALHLVSRSDDSMMAVFPADHLISDQDGFLEALLSASEAADKGALVLLGAEPESAATGLGYIRTEDLPGENASAPLKVIDFIEKPGLELARRLISERGTYWNTGMFVFKAAVYLKALEELEPEMFRHCSDSYDKAVVDMDFIRIDESSFSRAPSNSIDYAVLERTDQAWMVPFKSAWSDIGSWLAMHQSMPADVDGNTALGDVVMMDTKNSHVHSSSRMVATIGVSRINIVETDDCVLVTDIDKTEMTKELVNRLVQAKRKEAETHAICYRPWGHYESLNNGPRFQVKRITVHPGAKLSLQSHFHRAEHWVVVSGTALVTNGDEEVLLTENQSCYIPLGNVHRLENPGGIPLELIEVQSGSYLGEDDIVRYDDVYGRSPQSEDEGSASAVETGTGMTPA